ncbi:MAG: hypothetical protein LBC35_05190 [Coriobacteriales bacterium]|jgi:hypothetical protein|nr:hypothetical protein [Coriobacteriales bacterium]
MKKRLFVVVLSMVLAGAAGVFSAACSSGNSIVGTWDLGGQLAIEANADGTFLMVAGGTSVAGTYEKTGENEYYFAVPGGGETNVAWVKGTQKGDEFTASGSISYDAKLGINMNMTDSVFKRTSNKTSGSAPTVDSSALEAAIKKAAQSGSLDESTRIYTTGNDTYGTITFLLPDGWEVGTDGFAQGKYFFNIENSGGGESLSLNAYSHYKSPEDRFEFLKIPSNALTNVRLGDNQYLTDIDYKKADSDTINWVLTSGKAKDGSFVVWELNKKINYNNPVIQEILTSLKLA